MNTRRTISLAVVSLVLAAPLFMIGTNPGHLGGVDPLEQAELDLAKNPEARAEFEVSQRLGSDGTIPDGALMNAKRQFDELASQARLKSPDKDAGIAQWDWIGPGNIGGRLRAIATHPTQTNTMWIGGVAGGIWKTTTGGSSWSPQSDFVANLAVTSIVVDPTDPDILFAGTGEGFGNADALKGAGVFRSIDGGVTWAQLPATANWDFDYVNRVAHHPAVSGTVLAATGSGLWRTTNDGAGWDRILIPSGNSLDVRYHPTDPLRILVGTSSNAYLSTDGGTSFTHLTSALAGMISPASPGRCEVTFAASDSDYLYISVNENSGEIWRSTDGGTTWNLRSTGYNYLSAQGWYDNAIWVSPVDPDFLLVGGLDIWRSTNGGTTLTRISDWRYYHRSSPFSAHADQHFFVHHPDFDGVTNRRVYVGNDGGIQVANNIATVSTTSGWGNLANNLGITQFYGGAAVLEDSMVVGGTQDNDHLRYLAADGPQDWYQAETGDGGFAAINYLDNTYVYSEYVYLLMEKSYNGGASYLNRYTGLGDAGSGSTALFIAPFVMDPVNPSILYGGGRSIWRTTNAAETWSSFKSPVSGNPKCSSIDVAPSDTDVIWVGYNNGQVDMTTNGGSSWTRVDNNAGFIPGRYVTDIAIHPLDPDRVVVTIGGYQTDTVWYTENGGSTWSLIDGTAPFDLPAIQVNTVRWHPDGGHWLYIGTDLGVLASEDTGENWSVTPFQAGHEGPVNTRVSELFWQGNQLIAATHGRGMFRTTAISVPVTPPVAGFSADPVNGCSPLPVNFTDSSTGTVTSWDWDFGDGNTSTLENPFNLYFSAGTYTVTLTVTGPLGTDAMTKVDHITVEEPPALEFSATPLSGPVPLDVDFSDLTTGSPSTWNWNFGDGGSSTDQNPSHTFTTPGTYSITLVVEAPCGNGYLTKPAFITADPLAAPVAGFTGIPLTGCSSLEVAFSDTSSGAITGWAWDFGDTGTDTVQNPNHIYADSGTYSVSLTVTGPGGSDTLTQAEYITVADPVAAAFSLSDTTGTAPLTVDFTDISTGSPASWAWDFGDTGAATTQNPSHTYTAAGVFTVILIAANTCEADTASLDITVNTVSGPVAGFSGAPTSGCGPLAVDFSDESTGDIDSWLWDFGDSETDTIQNPNHVYTQPGPHDVRLMVFGPGGSDTLTVAGYVTVDSTVTADFSASTTEGPNPLTVDFSDLSTGGATSWAWDFGDADSDTTDNPAHTYTTEGTYTVTLTAGNACGSDVRIQTDLIIVRSPAPVGDGLPAVFGLAPNYPNPFNPMTTLVFSLADESHARLDVFDATGRKVDTLVDRTLGEGEHRINWQPQNLASGVYFARLHADGQLATRRLVLIR